MLISTFAHAGHPEFITHEGGHALMAVGALFAASVAVAAVYYLVCRVILKSAAVRSSSGTEARSGSNRRV